MQWVMLPVLALAMAPLAHPAAAAPPAGHDWVETFREDCRGTALDPKIWKLSTDTWGKIMSVRDPMNVVLRGDGVCRLLYRNSPLRGKPWSTGGMVSQGFQQAYGYFEVRMKYAPATGAHQSFWIVTQDADDAPGHFEIDINEGQYRGKVSAGIHLAPEPGQPPTPPGHSFDTGLDLSADYHLYGLLWLPDPGGAKLTFFLDGKPFHSLICRTCTRPAPIRLTGAVVSWARPTPALDGLETAVKDIRIYQLRHLLKP